MSAVVTVSGFRKTYGPFVAVDNISFGVEQGEIFGLLGPNGAGKTTTLECLEGLRVADAGSLDIMGVDPARETRKLRNLIGVQLQQSGLPESMTVSEAMRFFSGYHGVSPRPELLDRLGLREKMSTQYSNLSTGQQRRLSLALAVTHRPPVVFLDEPTAGLDVASRAELHSMMRELQGEGTSIILATHDMAEAEKMADRVAILLRGKIVAIGSPLELTATGGAFTKISVHTEKGSLAGNGSFPGVTRRQQSEEYTIYYTSDPGPAVAAIIAHIDEQQDKLIDLRVERPSLEERFLELTTQGVRR